MNIKHNTNRGGKDLVGKLATEHLRFVEATCTYTNTNNNNSNITLDMYII